MRTAEQIALGSIGATSLANDVDWAVVRSASLLAAAVRVLMSLAGLPEATSPLRHG